MTFPKVTIGLVLYKGLEYLDYSIPALLYLDYPNLEILIRDQSPKGEVYEYLKTEMSELTKKPHVKIEKGENLFHSGGHNALIRQMSGEYYLCCSNDMWYDHHLVQKMVEEMEKPENKKYGSATCKLMQWDFEKRESESEIWGQTNRIDSLGIRITKGHQFYDIGQREEDHGQYDQLKEVFGASGALALYRKKALDQVKYLNKKGEAEYFDEMIHYKNDVDLAYRLQWAGYPCLLIHSASVYHDRQMNRNTKKSKWMRENSLFGHLAVLRKNFDPRFSFSVRFWTRLMQIARFLNVFFFDRSLLKQYDLVSKESKIIEVKKQKMKRKMKVREIEKWMNNSTQTAA